MVNNCCPPLDTCTKKKFRWCQWGAKQRAERRAERRVKCSQTLERRPTSAPAEIHFLIAISMSNFKHINRRTPLGYSELLSLDILHERNYVCFKGYISYITDVITTQTAHVYKDNPNLFFLAQLLSHSTNVSPATVQLLQSAQSQTVLRCLLCLLCWWGQ